MRHPNHDWKQIKNVDLMFKCPIAGNENIKIIHMY